MPTHTLSATHQLSSLDIKLDKEQTRSPMFTVHLLRECQMRHYGMRGVWIGQSELLSTRISSQAGQAQTAPHRWMGRRAHSQPLTVGRPVIGSLCMNAWTHRGYHGKSGGRQCWALSTPAWLLICRERGWRGTLGAHKLVGKTNIMTLQLTETQSQ